MSKGSGWAAALAEGINGYIRGTQMERKNNAEDADAEFQAKQRARTETQWGREDKLQNDLTAAAAPVTVTAGAGGYTKPDSADNSDVGQPDGPSVAGGGLIQGVTVNGQGYTDPKLAQAAADSQNTEDAVAKRQAGAYSAAGMPMQAAQLKHAVTQGKLGELQLGEAQKKFLDEKWNDTIGSVKSKEQLAAALDGSPLAGGKHVQAVPSSDGKTFQLMAVDEGGQMTALGPAIDDNAKGIQRAIADSSKMPIVARIGMMQHYDQMEQRDKQFTQTIQMHREQLASQDRHNRAMEGNAAATTALHARTVDIQEKALKNDPFYNVPGGVKLKVNSLGEGIKQLDATINKAIADGTASPAGLQQLQSQRATMVGQLNDALDPYLPKTPDSGKKNPSTYAATFGGGGKPVAAGGIAAAPAGSVVNTGGTWSAGTGAAAGGLPQPTGAAQPGQNLAPGANSGLPPAAEGAGSQLDSARAAYAQAVQQLQSFGARQQQANPQGFQQAQAAVAAAKAAQDQAEAAWSQSVGTMPAAFPAPRM